MLFLYVCASVCVCMCVCACVCVCVWVCVCARHKSLHCWSRQACQTNNTASSRSAVPSHQACQTNNIASSRSAVPSLCLHGLTIHNIYLLTIWHSYCHTDDHIYMSKYIYIYTYIYIYIYIYIYKQVLMFAALKYTWHDRIQALANIYIYIGPYI